MTEPTRRFLLACGLFSSLLYAAMNVLGPLLYPDYRSAEQAVSELSAIGAPSRQMWIGLGLTYTVLVALFGLAVRVTAAGQRALRAAGTALIAYGALGLFAPFVPMQPRGAAFALTDALHLALTAATLVLMLAALVCGAFALGRRFRAYSFATLAALLAFGNLTARDGSRLAQGQATPWMGVWERIDLGVFLLWVAILSIALLRRDRAAVGGFGLGARAVRT